MKKKSQSVWIIIIINGKLSNGKNKKRSGNGGWTEEDGEIAILEKQVLRQGLNGKRNRMSG